jgi:uncharacterized membrane protein YhfC
MAAVIIFIVIAMILLFISMVMSAIGADNVTKKEYDTAWKYSMISAVVSGISVAMLIVTLIIYVNSEKIATKAHEGFGHLQQRMIPYAGTGVQYA